MISIICGYNNKRLLEKCLLKSLKKQTAKFEIVMLDNSKSVFNSAPKALNYLNKKAKGEYLMFVHQDVYLRDNRWLEKAESFLSSIPNLGIAGTAGRRNIKFYEIPLVLFGIKKAHIGMVFHKLERKCWSFKINTPIEVQTLDEQLLIIPKKVFDSLQFDEENCNGWHLYGVEYCLSLKKLGLKSFVLPLSVRHLSKGRFDESYFEILQKILKKHRREKIISTTMGIWFTNRSLNFILWKFKEIKRILIKYFSKGRK